MLTQVARRLRALFREGDIVGRVGGDEFVVFLREMGSEEAVIGRVQQICGSLRQIVAGEKSGCPVSCSIGIALFPEHGGSFQELYKNADSALYVGKGCGKNTFRLYSPAE